MARINMGLGEIGTSGIIFKRKFRWTFQVQGTCAGGIPAYFVKTASRPNLEIEETEINYLNGKTWIPGKATWQAITVTYYDVNRPEIVQLYNWLTSIYDFTDPDTLYMNSKNDKYSGTGVLSLYDGCGAEMERWELKNLWPQAMNFGDLDMSNSEECTIELTCRYTNVKYTSFCPGGVSPCTCSPC